MLTHLLRRLALPLSWEELASCLATAVTVAAGLVGLGIVALVLWTTL